MMEKGLGLNDKKVKSGPGSVDLLLATAPQTKRDVRHPTLVSTLNHGAEQLRRQALAAATQRLQAHNLNLRRLITAGVITPAEGSKLKPVDVAAIFAQQHILGVP